MVRRQGTHALSEQLPSVLNGRRHARLPLVERLPSRLNRANNTLFKVCRVLLHDDNRLLQRVLLVDLLVKLFGHMHVDDVRIILGRHGHGRVLEDGDVLGQVRDELGGELALASDGRGELASVILDVLSVKRRISDCASDVRV